METYKGKPVLDNESKDIEIKKKGFKSSTVSKIEQKKARIRQLRQEASKMASKANKRIQRLEKNDYTDSPAYKQYIEGKGKFSVRGKSYNQLQSELARLRGFLQSKTSTIRGSNNVLKEIAVNTGVKYKTLKELKTKSAKFFVLASKIEQYLRSVHDAASAIGYQKIWESINVHVQTGKLDLEKGEENVDSMIKTISDALVDYETPEPIFDDNMWYSLKKD